MSKYTTQLRWIVEQFAGDDSLSIKEKIDKSLPLIFNFDFPIWSESYRIELERKIVKHYLMKEIGLETVGLWQLFLDERLNLIMPYYNDLYTTISKKYDWLEDVNITEDFDSKKKNDINVTNNNSTNSNTNEIENNTSKQDGKNNSKIDRTSKNLNSDFPQANYAGLDYGTNLIDSNANEKGEDTQTNNITSNANRNNSLSSETNGTNKTISNSNDLYTKTLKGLNGSKSRTQLNIEYRNSLLNIDKMIIDELYDLFMLIY